MVNALFAFCSVRAFDGLLQLLTLNLSMNEIKTIPNGAFVGLVSLRQIDLSFNHIRKLDNKTNGVLDDCLSLEKVSSIWLKLCVFKLTTLYISDQSEPQ